MTAYGGISIRAWHLIVEDKQLPSKAWDNALIERYIDPDQLKNARKHTCPKGAFLGLCEEGYVKSIIPGKFTNSVDSKLYAIKAAQIVLADPAIISDRQKLAERVYNERTPNDEINVVLALNEKGLLQNPS